MRRGVDRWSAMSSALLAVAGFSLLNGPATAGPAIGQFEIKTLESEPGEIEFQSQNAYMFGNPKRKTLRNADRELEADANALARQRNALELEFGITRYLKTRIGIEYEKERRDDPSTLRNAEGYEPLKLDEYAAEVIGIIIPRHGDGFGLGIVAEYEISAESGGGQTLNVGPIFEWARGPWSVTVIPTVVQFFGGGRNEAGQQDEKMDFSYANQLKYHWSSKIDLAIESYGTIERVGGRGGRSEEAALFGDFDQHRIGPVIYYNFTPQFAASKNKEKLEDDGGHDDDEQMVSLGLGTLFGLNSNTPATTLKLSMEVVF